MNQNYIEYDDLGRIVCNHSLSPELYALNTDKQMIVGRADPDLQYIKDGEVMDRPEQSTELFGTTLSRMPTPCTVYINGTAYECESDKAELSFDQPATYIIRVEAWPYQDFEVTYENQT